MNMQTQPMISVTKEKSRAGASGGRGAAGLGRSEGLSEEMKPKRTLKAEKKPAEEPAGVRPPRPGGGCPEPQKVGLCAETHSDFTGEGLSSPPNLVSREITREADRR